MRKWTIVKGGDAIALRTMMLMPVPRRWPGNEEDHAMTWQDRITVDPKILVGKPVVRGTRLAVEFIIDLLAQGWTEKQILDSYPGLVRDDISACLKYASETLKSERVYLTVS